MEEHEDKEELPWQTARVVLGRLIGISKNTNEITVEIKDDDGEWFEEDYDLPEDFANDQFDELLDYLDLDVRVTLIDNTVMKIVCSERLG